MVFRDLVTQSLGAGLGDTQVGFGTGVPLTVREFTQGAIQTSSGTMDAAIQGDGFFVVNDSSGNTLYTRAGNFEVDKSGNLMTDTGQYVQGWTSLDSTTGAVDTNGPVGNIVVPVGSLSPPDGYLAVFGGPEPELGGDGVLLDRYLVGFQLHQSRFMTASEHRMC